MLLLNCYVDVDHDLACFRVCLLVTVEENIISIFQITKFISHRPTDNCSEKRRLSLLKENAWQ